MSSLERATVAVVVAEISVIAAVEAVALGGFAVIIVELVAAELSVTNFVSTNAARIAAIVSVAGALVRRVVAAQFVAEVASLVLMTSSEMSPY